MGYRNDFCLTCAQPRRALRVRSFDVVHLFFVPLVPLGFLRRWHCAVCNNDPHDPGVRKGFKWAAAFALAVFSITSWLVSPADEPWVWPARLGLPLLVGLSLWWALKSRQDIRLKDKLAEITPADDAACPFCGGPLIVSERRSCSHCGIERMTLKA